jgi:ATP-dependent DNA helicase RecQ
MCDVCQAVPEWLAGKDVDEPRAKRKKGTKAAAAVASASPTPAPKETPQPALRLIPDALREYMREWRRATAPSPRCVPAYVVLHDASLDELCRRRPSSLAELLKISGIGERKAELYGRQIFAALEKFDAGAGLTRSSRKKSVRLRKQCAYSPRAALSKRSLRSGTATGDSRGLVADLVERGKLKFNPEWVAADKATQIEAACRQFGLQWLKPLREALPPEISFEEVRLVVAKLRWEKDGPRLALTFVSSCVGCVFHASSRAINQAKDRQTQDAFVRSEVRRRAVGWYIDGYKGKQYRDPPNNPDFVFDVNFRARGFRPRTR